MNGPTEVQYGRDEKEVDMEERLRGLIFNQVQGSFVDGWGIRTTIFLKGCPLRCKWCCNPEGQSFQPELKVTYDKCNGCNQCISRCPRGALSVKAGVVQVDRGVCDACGACVDACCTGALEPFGRYYTVDEMFQFLIKDIPFYKSSGGGVTIGGGEATWHADFVLALMEKLQREGIHVAVDTCGYVTDEKGIQVLRKADLILFDIKGMDPQRHLENTGVSNDVIWKNLRMLGEMRKPIIVRVPVIPGYTDDDSELRKAAQALSEIKSVKRVDILPVHHFGSVKYRQIGMDYVIDPDSAVPEQRQQEIKALFEACGFPTQIGG